MLKIYILDLGWGNLGSLEIFFRRFSHEVEIVNFKDDLKDIENSLIIWPGVGSAESFKKIDHEHKVKMIKHFKAAKKNIAICLGFQFLFCLHEESNVEGLKIFDGNVRKLKKPNLGYHKILDSSERFYFNHSFGIDASDQHHDFLLNIDKKNLLIFRKTESFLGCQFHPEKSGSNGVRLIKDFLCLD